MSDRVLVMYEGRVKALFDRAEVDEAVVLRAATGVEGGLGRAS
jgi:ABC-type sugar transport system ATPase subunit